jgi:hypothetical protein
MLRLLHAFLRPTPSRRPVVPFRPGVEPLEGRALPGSLNQLLAADHVTSADLARAARLFGESRAALHQNLEYAYRALGANLLNALIRGTKEEMRTLHHLGPKGSDLYRFLQGHHATPTPTPAPTPTPGTVGTTGPSVSIGYLD